jgi:trimeric autotransporter adhesin
MDKTMTRFLAILAALTCAASAQTYRTVTADTNNVIRTNFTIDGSQLTGSFPAELVRTNGSALGLTNFPASLLRTNGDGGGLTNLPNANLTNATGILPILNGGTGATNASAARTALELGTAATNDSTAFQSANTNLTALASGDGSSLTNVTITDASSLTNFPAELLRTNGSAGALTNFPSELLRTNGDGGGLTNISVDLTTVLPSYTGNTGKVLAVASGETNVEWTAISNTVTDASSLTNFPTLNQNTTGTASNVTGVVAIANGGSGQTTAAAAIEAFLPLYSGNADRILALNSNATALLWTTNAGGGGLTSPVAIVDGGTGATNAATALTNFGILGVASVVIGGENITGGNTIVGSGATADDGSGGFGAVAIGRAAVASNSAVAIGYNALGRSAGGGVGAVAVGYQSTSTNRGVAVGYLSVNGLDGAAVGFESSSLNGFAGGKQAVATATNASQIGTGSNGSDNTIQFMSAGSVDTNEWSGLANSTVFGHYVMAAPTNGTNGQILALNSNATAVVWTDNAAGGGLPETPLAISNGGTAATTAQGALTNLTLIAGNRVKLGTDTTNTSNAGITIGGGAALGVNSPSVVIGSDAFSSGTESVVIGRVAKNTNVASAVVIGLAAKALDFSTGAIAIGVDAIVGATAQSPGAVQIGSGSNSISNTIQFRQAGSISTNEWATLAALSTYPTTNIQVTVVGGATNTLVFSNGILTSVTTP